MKQASYILEKMRNFLFTKEFCNSYKINEKDFVRTRILTIQVIFFFILNLPKRSIAIELLNFSLFLIKDVSRAAITKARAKLAPHAFIGLNQVLVKEFYTDNQTNTFCGFTLIAIDGSLVELPLNSPQIEQKYGAASNQTNCKKPMARSSSAFDVLNGITLDAILAPYQASERDLAIQHIENLCSFNLSQSFLLLFDRGYPSAALIIYLLLNNINFLMRSNTQFMKEVNEVIALNKKDTIIKFKAKRAGEAWKALKKLFPHLNSKDCFSLRVLVVTLSTGEKEILLTSLLDKIQYPYKIFKDLYFKRWGIEEEYGFKKGSIEIENFSGKSCTAVEQDFYAAIMVGNVHALLAYEAQNEMKQQEKAGSNKYDYKINKNVGVAILKDNLIDALIQPNICLKAFSNRIKQVMKRNLVPIRPGRSRPRKKKHLNHKYHMNKR